VTFDKCRLPPSKPLSSPEKKPTIQSEDAFEDTAFNGLEIVKKKR
jgi:hypothetical protein